MPVKFHLVVFILYIYVDAVFSSFCYWNTACSYRYFSTKTPYNAVRGDIRDSVINLPECEPISIWGIFRSGRTYPDPKSAIKMKEAIAIRDLVVSSYEKGRCSLCAQDIDNLRDWAIDKDMFDKTSALHDEGRKEMFGVASRLKEVYTLLKELDRANYAFRSTQHRWVKESAKAFMEGLGNKNLVMDELTSDAIKTDVEEDPAWNKEMNKYTISPDYLAAKDRIQRRLGLDYSLTSDNITALYDLCWYTWSGLNNKASPWCALFTTEDLKVLEYIGDLEHYYKDGHGRQSTNMNNQIPLPDLLETFQLAKSGKGRKITACFTRSRIMDMVYAALGWFKDSKPITAADKKRDRLWRTSRINPHAANVVMVLNRCAFKKTSDYHVMFYLNEEPLRSVCEGGICSWTEFEKLLTPFRETTSNKTVS
ncbi:multiple inositol polyphosphate phosphatase 1-like [Leguminivora glycinivorella]|uniref:multiple inositol polyphosphate phosphatase 1-like n=1 Tax=Leguminivora glycinivorella TaxID=1035111 RepID=UPI00200F0292|nr:multiple inositol polyphosphate phosphatase 1-like [Leguminivora glycinivorella]